MTRLLSAKIASPDTPGEFALITPTGLRALGPRELGALHRALHAAWAAFEARAGREAIEYRYVHPHVWIVQEMQRRGMRHQPQDRLDAVAAPFMKHAEEPLVLGHLRTVLAAADDAVLVPQYISVVGSAAEPDAVPRDLDVLVRDDQDRLSTGDQESLMLLCRKLLDPDKALGLRVHLLFNAKGPHLARGQGYVPIADLVLRPRRELERVTKQAAEGLPAFPDWERFLDQASTEGLRVDLGPWPGPAPEGFVGMGRGGAEDILADLDGSWPLAPESVAVIRAHHVLEHLDSATDALRETWRVLRPGGLALITVPSTAGDGAFAHPEHRTFWNRSSFLFWTDPRLWYTLEAHTPMPFDLVHLAERGEGARVYVDAVLRKPTEPVEDFLRRFYEDYPELVPQRRFKALSKAEAGGGIMVGFFLGAELGRRLAMTPGSEAPEDLHLTLAYLGPTEETPRDALPRLRQVLRDFAREAAPIDGRVTGTGRFDASDTSGQEDVVVALVDAPQLGEFREKLCRALAEAGLPARRDHGFIPHVTLSYALPGTSVPLERVESATVRFDTLTLTRGPERETFPLGADPLARRALAPIARFQPPKPAQKGRAQTDAFTPGELWPWVSKHLEAGRRVWAEPKYNGFRGIIQKDGERISLVFEDAQAERWPALRRANSGLARLEELPDVILDANVWVRDADGPWSRPRLMVLLRDRPELPPGARVELIAFDVLYWDGDSLNEQPFAERRARLEAIAERLRRAGIRIPPKVAIETQADLTRAWRSPMFGLASASEGLVLKTSHWVYEPGPSTDGMAKIKHALEVKALVLERQQTADGGWNYRGGLDPGRLRGTITNLVEYRGAQYVDLGFSFNTKDVRARPGDILTAQVEEIAWNERTRHLNWLGAIPLDVDATRATPFAARQVLDLAKRARVLQVTPRDADDADDVTKSMDPGDETRGGSLVPTLTRAAGVRRAPRGATWAEESGIIRANGRLPVARASHRFLAARWTHKNGHPRCLACGMEEPVGGVCEGLARRDTHKAVDVVPAGPRTARLAIVGDGPGEEEEREGRVLVGPSGQFICAGLTELGIDHEREIWWANIYTRQDEKRRGARTRELGQARLRQLAQLPNLKAVLALSAIAAEGLTGQTGPVQGLRQETFKTPQGVPIIVTFHPAALLRSGQKASDFYPRFRADVRRAVELAFGARRTKAKEPTGEGGETRGETATRNWERTWHEAMPLSGRLQRFILHAHWRGLSEDEAKFGMEALLKTDHSLHFDLRLGTDRFRGWFGITLFAGSTAENRAQLRVARMQHDPEEKIQSAPKLFGPAAWLQVGLRAPFVVEPGGVGSTARTFSKFFAIDSGTWRLGYARAHAIEVFLDGRQMKGRHLWALAAVGGRRFWLFTRPEDQQPFATSHELDAVARDVRSKRQTFLVWPKDPATNGTGHVLHRVADLVKAELNYRLLKADAEQRYTLGVAYPANEVDAHKEFAKPEELESAAWAAMLRGIQVGVQHRPGSTGAGTPVESYIYRGPTWRVNGQEVTAGDWLLGVVWHESVWPLVKSGQIAGFSIQGYARSRST